jgi:hypothetical protein
MHVQRFERVEPVAEFVRIPFGVADHPGISYRILHGGMAVAANPVGYLVGLYLIFQIGHIRCI